MNKSKINEVDFMILSSIVNSDENYDDILLMVQRFTAMRLHCSLDFSFASNIQNPRPVGDETDIEKEV